MHPGELNAMTARAIDVCLVDDWLVWHLILGLSVKDGAMDPPEHRSCSPFYPPPPLDRSPFIINLPTQTLFIPHCLFKLLWVFFCLFVFLALKIRHCAFGAKRNHPLNTDQLSLWFLSLICQWNNTPLHLIRALAEAVFHKSLFLKRQITRDASNSLFWDVPVLRITSS